MWMQTKFWFSQMLSTFCVIFCNYLLALQLLLLILSSPAFPVSHHYLISGGFYILDVFLIKYIYKIKITAWSHTHLI